MVPKVATQLTVEKAVQAAAGRGLLVSRGGGASSYAAYGLEVSENLQGVRAGDGMIVLSYVANTTVWDALSNGSPPVATCYTPKATAFKDCLLMYGQNDD